MVDSDPFQLFLRRPNRLCGLCLLGLVWALQTPGCSRESEPWGVYVSPQLADLGVVHGDKPVSHEFQIKNATSTAVRIVDMQISCGCTSLNLSQRLIEPGDSIQARMDVSLEGQTGRRTFQARLVTDCKSAPFLDLILQAEVVVERRDRELIVDIGAFPPGEEISTLAWISKGGFPTARLTAVDTVSGPLSAAIETQALPRENAIPIKLSGRAPLSPGLFDTVLHATVQGGSWSESQIRIRGTVTPRWSYPGDVYVGFANDTKSAKASFVIKDRFPAQGSSHVRDVTTSAASPFVVIARTPANGVLTVDVELPASAKPGAASTALVIRIVRDENSIDELTVNLFGRVTEGVAPSRRTN